jgi:hypothetical protein
MTYRSPDPAPAAIIATTLALLTTALAWHHLWLLAAITATGTAAFAISAYREHHAAQTEETHRG